MLEERPIDTSAVSLRTEDTDFSGLVERLDRKFPPVSREGFDFAQISGNAKGRTRKAIVLQLACHGWSVAQIADHIEIPTNTVGAYLSTAIQEANPIADVEILRNFELQKLDSMERSAWEQFERSCEDAVTKEGDPVVRSGNPAYMRVLLDISKRRATLVGLDSPAKVEVDTTTRKLVINEIVVTNREEALAAKKAGLLK